MTEHPRILMVAHLGLAVEAALHGATPAPAPAGAWERWWVAYRLARSARHLGWTAPAASGSCATCCADAARLSQADPPHHTDHLTEVCDQGCLRRWAAAIRSGGSNPGTPWPSTRLALAVIKPGAPAGIARDVADHYRVLHQVERTLSVADVRRLYPEAYGAEFVAARDAYLTSGPVRVLVLLAETDPVDATALKHTIRARYGADRLRNHLHIADNPGETYIDIAHLVGPKGLTDLYGTYELDGADERLAHHRALLGLTATSTGGLRPRTT
ncbi:hypothetical protein AB0I72_19015 [Nocardiopsis sp. NPDC049922]|uniref:hypothetical protein n=1 Tax=Nocardiopsis sp. NPDC049922 TaxID=3155157 RepID=UPI0033DFE8E4